MTLRSRITLLTLGLLASSLLAIGVLLYSLLSQSLYRNLRTELIGSTQQSLQILDKVGMIDFTASLPPSSLIQLDVAPSITELMITGDVIHDSTPALKPDPLVLPLEAYRELLKRGQIWTTVSRVHSGQQTEKLQVLAVSVPPSAATSYLVTFLLVAKPLGPITDLLAQFVRAYLLTSLAVLVMAGLLASRLVRRTMEPLEWVAERAERMSERPGRLPEPEGQDEVASLVRTLNRMLARLDEAWETQTRFLADASHELRTPVTAILGHINYLLRRTGVSEQQKESFEIIRRESERMKKLVDDLLDLSKSGSWKVELGPIHLQTLLGEIAEEFGQSFVGEDGSRITGNIELEVPVDLWALGDPDRLHQVFANLVTNAQKAHASEIQLIARDLPGGVVVQVKDNGEGISPEHLPNLFERFYRVDRARDRERGGTGLGLAIVRSIVEAHGGKIWAESEPGKGSIFSVSLKHAAAPSPQLA